MKRPAADRGRLMIGAIPLSTGASLDEQVLDRLCAGFADRSLNGPIVTFCNPGSHVRIARDAQLAADVERCDYVLPDGIALVLAARALGARSERLSFDTTSLALPVLEAARDAQARVALAGGAPGVAERAAERLSEQLGANPFHATFDGYIPLPELVDRLLAGAPDLVVVGMGTGPQERLMIALRDAGYGGAAFSCGGYLDQLSDGLHYYPALVDRLHLRAPYRLLSEPRRLGPRYLVDYPRFGWAFLGNLLGRRQ